MKDGVAHIIESQKKKNAQSKCILGDETISHFVSSSSCFRSSFLQNYHLAA